MHVYIRPYDSLSISISTYFGNFVYTWIARNQRRPSCYYTMVRLLWAAAIPVLTVLLVDSENCCNTATPGKGERNSTENNPNDKNKHHRRKPRSISYRRE